MAALPLAGRGGPNPVEARRDPAALWSVLHGLLAGTATLTAAAAAGAVAPSSLGPLTLAAAAAAGIAVMAWSVRGPRRDSSGP